MWFRLHWSSSTDRSQMPTPPFSAQSHRQDQFSIAYVSAVAAAAGCAISIPHPDNDKVDVTLSSRVNGAVFSKPKIDLQVKCQASGPSSGSTLSYSIDDDTYNALRDPGLVVPRILVVVLVPRDFQTWLDHTDTEMSVRHSGYWISLKGSPPIATNSTTVHLPTQNKFDAFQLQAMMRQVADGNDLITPLSLMGTIS